MNNWLRSTILVFVPVCLVLGCSSNEDEPEAVVARGEELAPPVIELQEAFSGGAEAEQTTKRADESSQPSDDATTEWTGRVTLVSVKTLLGSPELTAGIPGAGTLAVAEIEAWLAQEGNHAPLEIQLPLGLRAGVGQVQGLDENPLTRAKIELGRQLYFDTRLSSDNTVSCASCHHPDEGLARHTQFGVGVNNQQGGRNSPVTYNRIFSNLQFWDGRAASLEEQAKGSKSLRDDPVGDFPPCRLSGR